MPSFARIRVKSERGCKADYIAHSHDTAPMPLLRLHLLRHGQTNASRGNLFLKASPKVLNGPLLISPPIITIRIFNNLQVDVRPPSSVTAS